MNPKGIQKMKTEIEESSALNVGYYTAVVGKIINELGEVALTDILGSDLGDVLVEQVKNGRNAEAMNIFVTEAVRQMTYEEFQVVAPYFFNYHKEEGELFAQPLEPTETVYTQLFSAPERYLGEPDKALLYSQLLVENINTLPITTVSWDVEDPELKGVPVKEISEHKKEVNTSTLRKVLSEYGYALLTGHEYKERLEIELAEQEYIEPWSANPGSCCSITDLPDDYMVLLDVDTPEEVLFWGRDYKELLKEIYILPPFGDLLGNCCPEEDGWDTEVDFEELKNTVEEQAQSLLKGIEALQEEIVNFEEDFEAVLHETAFYLPLEQSAFASLAVLTDEQLEEVREAQEHQLQDTREGIDQATYEISEEGADISDIDDWVKDFKVGVLNLKYILSEQRYRVEQKKSQGKKAKCK